MTQFSRNLSPLVLSTFMMPAVASADPQSFEMPRADGSVIHWTLDGPQDAERTGLLVLAQGSGCLSVVNNENLAMTRTIFGEFAALSVEKYGVASGDNPADDHTECSEAFREHHTVSQRIADYRQVIEGLRGESWWNGELVLFGGSEGGLAMAILASQVQADAAILFSTAGGLPFGQIVRQSIPEEGWPTVNAAFENARRNPDSSELWGGSSLRFWADIIDRRVADDMLRSDAAFLLIQGGNDPSSPVSAARATSDLFADAGRCNLTYWEFPGLNHGMADASGNGRMAEVLSQAAAWLRERNAANVHADCMGR